MMMGTLKMHNGIENSPYPNIGAAVMDHPQ